MNCDILHLTFSSKGRDVDICEPVLSYLEIKYGLNIERRCVRDYAEILRSIHPRLMLIEPRGAAINVCAIRFAKAMGIAVVGIEGEGDHTNWNLNHKDFYWGWNKPEYSQPDLFLMWSSESLRIIEKVNPGYADKYHVKVSGATGFDKYKILQWMEKDTFLEKYNLEKFKKVIGFASWGFDSISSQKSEESKFHQEAGNQLNSILREVIKRNKDILFILKLHPSTIYAEKTEFRGLDVFENVIVFKNEENVSNLINVCDIWMGYETTTCLEAWLLGKTTALINPLGGAFRRSIIATGSPILTTVNEIQERIEEFYSTGKIHTFDALKECRINVVREIIEFDDGLNHVRAGEQIYELLRQYVPNSLYDGFNCRWDYLIRMIKKRIYKSPISKMEIFKNSFQMFRFFEKNFEKEEREFYHNLYKSKLIDFYKRAKCKDEEDLRAGTYSEKT